MDAMSDRFRAIAKVLIDISMPYSFTIIVSPEMDPLDPLGVMKRGRRP